MLLTLRVFRPEGICRRQDRRILEVATTRVCGDSITQQELEGIFSVRKVIIIGCLAVLVPLAMAVWQLGACM
ncbi:MAG TPA: hypothetical protein VGL74_03500, partial [Terriglobales bacterium]